MSMFRNEKNGNGTLLPDIGGDWDDILEDIFDDSRYDAPSGLYDHLSSIQNNLTTVYPDAVNIFRCFKETRFENVKCVIVGHDPYPAQNLADGRCFSISDVNGQALNYFNGASNGSDNVPGKALNVLINERMRDELSIYIQSKTVPNIQLSFSKVQQIEFYQFRQLVNQLNAQMSGLNMNQPNPQLISQVCTGLSSQMSALLTAQLGIPNIINTVKTFVNSQSNTQIHTSNFIRQLNTQPYTIMNEYIPIQQYGSVLGSFNRQLYKSANGIIPSNKNFLINKNTGRFYAQSGDLSEWARNGVLLLNGALTIESSGTRKRAKWLWFTKKVVERIAERKTNEGCAFIFFGGWWKEFYNSFYTRFSDNYKYFIRYFEHPVAKPTQKSITYSGVFSDIIAHLNTVDGHSAPYNFDNLFPLKL